MRRRKKNVLRYLGASGLLLGICAWLQTGIIVAAEPKKTDTLKESMAIDGEVEHLVNCEDASSWEGMVKVNTEIKRSGQFSFELYGKYRTEIISLRMIPVDMQKTYLLSAYFRSLDGQLPASAFFGLRMYDENKNPITLQNVCVFDNTETTLASDAAKGSKELRITGNKNWLNVTHAAIAFNVKSNFCDLPNYDLSPQIGKVINDGATCRVVLKGALVKTYPRGTSVRLHTPEREPFYWVASGWMPTEWEKFSTTMSGEAQSGIPSDKFWPGTKYVRVFVRFANYDKIPQEGARLLVDDITFICGDKNIIEQQALSAIFCNPKILQEQNKQWRFQTDTKDEGLSAGWMNTDFIDEGWPLIDTDHWWQDQGYPEYHGVAWYRKTISPVMIEIGQKYFIYFGAVDGDASVFVNGRKIGEHNLLPDGGGGWFSPFYFDITDYLVIGRSNAIAVRVKKDAYKSGIYKGVKIIGADRVIGEKQS
ncbi:MAG: sugar-binding domain-containing protein [Victivallales bacterium]